MGELDSSLVGGSLMICGTAIVGDLFSPKSFCTDFVPILYQFCTDFVPIKSQSSLQLIIIGCFDAVGN